MCLISEEAQQLLEVVETYITDISKEFKEGLAQIKKENVEVLNSVSNRLSTVKVESQALRRDIERLEKQIEDVAKGISKDITDHLQGMPFFLQPCTQHQIVITNKDLENLERMDLDLGSVSAETETSTQEVAQPCTSTPDPQTPAPSRKTKFFWKWNSAAEDWLYEKCRKNSFSRSRAIKSEIFKEGIREKLWTDSVTWSVRVFNKIDTICKGNY